MEKDLAQQMMYITAYLKTHQIEDMSTYELFRFQDFLRENKEAYIKYSGKNDFNSKITTLWNILSVAVGYCIFLKSNLILSLLVGTGLITAPNITLSKLSTMEYNELVTRINNAINTNLNKENNVTRKLVNSNLEKEG